MSDRHIRVVSLDALALVWAANSEAMRLSMWAFWPLYPNGYAVRVRSREGKLSVV
jgi:hypothetical protein